MLFQLLATVSVPLAAPVAPGENANETWHVVPEWSIIGEEQSFPVLDACRTKPAVTVIEESATSVLPIFATVMLCGALTCPAAVDGNTKDWPEVAINWTAEFPASAT